MKVNKIEILLSALFVLSALVLFPLSSAAQDEKNAAELAKVPRMTVEELKKLIDKKSDVVIVDTRDSSSYELGHIKGAVNIYYNPTGDPADREMTLVALPMDKPIVIYCACQNEEESAPMALELWHLGYDHDKVLALKGGSIRWEEIGYPFVPASGAAKAAAE